MTVQFVRPESHEKLSRISKVIINTLPAEWWNTRRIESKLYNPQDVRDGLLAQALLLQPMRDSS